MIAAVYADLTTRRQRKQSGGVPEAGRRGAARSTDSLGVLDDQSRVASVGAAGADDAGVRRAEERSGLCAPTAHPSRPTRRYGNETLVLSPLFEMVKVPALATGV